MINPERAKLIPVSGNNDTPDLRNAVDVQFNPASLKVSLSNTLKENQRNGNSRAAQFVDKSSSSLTVELIFDTSYIDTETEQVYRGRATNEGRERENIETGSDVRLITKRIADKFIKPLGTGQRLRAPKRCLFQWGAFEFLGLVESFEETLDFFSPEGRPLRATVALKLKEDRYQFRNRAVTQAARETPTLTPTGNDSERPNQNTAPIPGDSGNQPGNNSNRPTQNTAPVPGDSGIQSGNWRDTALFNGIESPRLPSLSALAVPSVSASASIGFSASAGIKTDFSASVGGTSTLTADVAPAFKFGASASLGTAIEGAFNNGPSAGSLISGNVRLRAETKAGVSLNSSNSATAAAIGQVGFD